MASDRVLLDAAAPDRTGSQNVRIVIVLTFLLAARVCSAATDRWEPFPPGVGGPWGGTVYRIVLADAADPDSAWAATAGGVYRWDGNRWVLAGLGGEEVWDLAACGGHPPREIWAALGDRGLWVLRNPGATWENASPGDGAVVKRVAVSPDCGRAWAAEERTDGDRIWRWTESGWQPGGALPTVSRLAAGPAGSVWIGTSGGLYRWPAGEGAPVRSGPTDIDAVEDLAAYGDRIAVAAGAQGLWVSTDAGNTWNRVDVRLGEFETVDAVGLASDGRILCWVGGDPGRLLEWPPSEDEAGDLEPPEPGWVPLSFALTDKGDWAGAAKAGAYRRGAGEGFLLESRGLVACWPSALAFDPTGSGEVAVAGGESGPGVAGAWVWEPEASDWRRVSGTGVSHVPWIGYRGGELWLALSGKGPARLPGVTAGLEVRAAGIPLSEVKYPGAVLPVPGEPDRLVASFLSTAYVTDDAGTTWDRPEEPLPDTADRPWLLAWDPTAGRLLAAGQESRDEEGWRGVVYQSEKREGGRRWTRWAVSPDRPCTALGIGTRDPSGPVFLGLTEGLWICSSEGNCEASDGVPAGWVSALAVDDRPGGAVVAAVVEGHGVYLSTDGGRAWEALPQEGLTPAHSDAPRVSALAFEPGTGRLVAGVPGRGLVYMDVVEPLAVTGSVWVVRADQTAAVLGCNAPAEAQVGWSMDAGTWTWADLSAEGSVEVPLPENGGALVVFVRFRGQGTGESPTYQVLVERSAAPPGSEEFGSEEETETPGGAAGSSGGGGGGGCFLGVLEGRP